MSAPTPRDSPVSGEGGGVLSRTVVSTIGMGVQGLARFAYTLLIGRLAGPESLGEISALLSLAVFAVLFWPAAAGVAASRFLPDLRLSDSALGVLKRSFAVSVIVLAILTVPGALLLGSDLAKTLGTVVLVVSYSGYVFVRGVLFGEDRITRATVLDTVASFVSITALVGVLLAGWHWATLLPLAASYAIFAVASWPRGGVASAGVLPGARREVLIFTRDSAIALLATGGLLLETMVFVRAFETPIVAGLFAAGLSLATPANQLAQSVQQVLVPHFARMLSGSARAIRSSLVRVFLVTLAAFVVLFGLLIWLSPWILSVFYGDSYREAVESMRPLLVAVCAMSITAAPAAYLIAVGRQGLFAKIWLTATVVGTAVMLVASPALGQWGVISGFLIGACGGSAAVVICGLTLAPRIPRDLAGSPLPSNSP
ncbi:lipopolysaccharide biosynthesis protein [Leucobacter viscericola]|uniref:Lipopolysaccharide biosynthesis protein n=1 Tax=Leucobacter viscericola TaxID=2714935 RepID=A0A6G7XF33_9MICO|nr:lipopolysaccharide biosynthesis protein [Leucobacter viscericola]QIK63007.1 lipopolysaccharide biosynthesis protein [Leucobacter viscericola]